MSPQKSCALHREAKRWSGLIAAWIAVLGLPVLLFFESLKSICLPLTVPLPCYAWVAAVSLTLAGLGHLCGYHIIENIVKSAVFAYRLTRKVH